MKVKYHEIGIEGQSNSQILFLKNKHLWFFISPEKKSRYFGGFLYYQNQVLRFLDEIDFQEKIEEIQILSPHETILIFKNNQAYLNLKENIFEIIFSSWQDIKITFDIKNIFDNDPYKRKIDIEKLSSSSLIVNEFLNNRKLIQILIEADSPLNFTNNWILKIYDFDKQRNSPPYEWHIYDGISGKVRELKIKILQPETQSNLHQDFHLYKNFNEQVLTPINMDNNLNYSVLTNFLLARINNLILDDYLPAGFPWFYENWFRDELLSLYLMKNFINQEFLKQRAKFYLCNLENIWDKNKFSPDNYQQSADTFLLLILNLPADFFLLHFPLLEKYLKLWQKKFDLENLPPFSTWEDTLERKIALEILAFYLKTLRRFARIKKSYVPLANDLKEKIINLIEKNQTDINLIFVYLFLTDIFPLSRWQIFFDKLLKENYLDWGGIASLPKTNPKFIAEDDGEIAKAYHQGDSWYYLNNLFAYSLKNINYQKFQNIIDQIKLASLTDLLFDGALGYPSEISSACQRKSQGALIQLWSISSLALFLL